MGYIFIVIIIAILISVSKVPKLVRSGEIKELILFSTLLFIGLVLNIRNLMHEHIPSPIGLLRIIYSPVSKWIDLLFS